MTKDTSLDDLLMDILEYNPKYIKCKKVSYPKAECISKMYFEGSVLERMWDVCDGLVETDSPEIMYEVVFNYDHKNTPGFFGGITEMFASIADNKKIQLPKEIKELFSKPESIEKRLREIIETKLYEEKDNERVLRNLNFKNSANYINHTFLQNAFQRPLKD